MVSMMNIVALALMGGAYANEHHVHKREPDVVYVTVEGTVYVTAGAEQPAATAAAAPAAAPAAVSPAAVVNAQAAPSVQVKTTSSAAAAAPAPAASSAASSGSAASAGSSGALGVTYSPYNADGSCKSADAVKSDLAQLAGYSVIRLYGTDCNQVSNVYNALASGQKLFLGIFDISDVPGQCHAIASGINNNWGVVDTVSVGNELVNSGQASVSQVAGYVSSARSTLRGLGYNGPVNTVDTFIATINNPGLCDVGDYVSVNAHAFFDGGITAQNAGAWVVQQIQRVSSVCGGKKTVITESGWPSQGQANGVAVPSKENQEAAISSIKSACGNDVFLYTAFNDYWKAPGAFNAEQYWGFLSN